MTITDDEARAFADTFQRMTANIEIAVRGKDRVVRQTLTCLLAGGHLLLEDNPGTGKMPI